MNTTLTLNVDLDGVLANWEARVVEILGAPIASVPRGLMWAKITEYNNMVQPFYATLPVMSDAEHLWSYIKLNFATYRILSASGSTPKDCAQQKKLWVRNILGEDVNAIIVKDGKDKAAYADSNSILIDDRQKVLDPWIQAGGIGILHTSAVTTIAQLQAYL